MNRHFILLINYLCFSDMVPEEMLVQALYDFTAQESGELDFRRGDVITVTDKVSKSSKYNQAIRINRKALKTLW